MTADDPRYDVPEADRAEQLQPVVPDEEDEQADDRIEVDPLRGAEADQLDQQADVIPDDEDYRPE